MVLTAHAESRKRNLGNVLRLLHERGAARQVDISDRLGLNRSTGISLVEELLALHLVTERPGPATGQPGRPSPVIAPSEDVVAVAIEIAAQTARVDIVALGGTVVVGEDLAIAPAALGPTRTLERTVSTVAGLLASRPNLRVVGAGVAVHGAVDDVRRVVFAPNLGWQRADIGMLDAILGTSVGNGAFPPVVVGNDADLGALGELRRGAGRGRRDFLYLSAERGVGGGLVVNGQLVLGASGLAGEVGHMKVGSSSTTCACGQRGCWETEIGAAALERRNARDSTVASWLGRGLGVLIPVLQPGLVILGGHLARLERDERPSIDAALADACPPHLARGIEIVASELGKDAASIGAAELAFDRVLDDPAAAPSR